MVLVDVTNPRLKIDQSMRFFAGLIVVARSPPWASRPSACEGKEGALLGLKLLRGKIKEAAICLAAGG